MLHDKVFLLLARATCSAKICILIANLKFLPDQRTKYKLFVRNSLQFSKSQTQAKCQLFPPFLRITRTMPSHTTFLCRNAKGAFELSQHHIHGCYWSSMVLISCWVWLRQARSHLLSWWWHK